MLKGLFALLTFGLIAFLFSCTKINEATELGDDLIPAVDNVNTFDTTLDVSAAYHPFNDSSKNFLSENMALGKLNDLVFGTTIADMYFNLSSLTYGTYPFGAHPDSVKGIDSVVLSLAYQGSYGDTANSQLSVEVSEIASGNQFNDTTLYRYDQPAIPTTGPVLGTKTFSFKSFRDTTQVIRKGDTSKAVNVLRIRLNNSLANKLTTDTSVYKNDSLFRVAFRGLAVKTTGTTGQGALAYFNLTDYANSKLIIYYRVGKSTGIDSAASISFIHSTYSQANSIRRTAGGEYTASINIANSQKVYIQSSPTGSYIGIKIPGLDLFPNKVIHRAELIAFKAPSNLDNFFTPPNRLILDHKGTNDSAYLFENDLQAGLDGTLNFSSFGGTLRGDNSFRFNITRYVQGIVTRKERNDSLRLYAPLRTNLFAKNLNQYITVSNLSAIAAGRVVLYGPTYADRNLRLRLRIVYSNL